MSNRTRPNNVRQQPAIAKSYAATPGVAELRESVDEFLARGGVIQRLDHGERGQAFSHTLRTIHEASAKAAMEKPKARRR